LLLPRPGLLLSLQAISQPNRRLESHAFDNFDEAPDQVMPKITKRTPGQKGDYLDAGRKDPGHALNQSGKPRSKRKDLKRWCGGKVGRDHDYKLTKPHTPEYAWFHYDVWTCTQCGKKWIRRPDKPPATQDG